MNRALVRLPATEMHDGGCDDLASCVWALAAGRTVVVGAHRTPSGHVLDEFVIATALKAARPTCSVGVAARVGAGRAASVIAREATAAQLLGACDAIVLEGDPAACVDAARVVVALFAAGTHTVSSGLEHIDAAQNLPGPLDGGPPVVWHDGDALLGLAAGTVVRVGDVVHAAATTALDPPVAGTLVVVDHELAAPAALAAALGR